MDACEVLSKKQIPNAFGRLYDTITELEKAVETNAASLISVLRNEPNDKCKDEQEQERQWQGQELVPIANIFTECNDRLRKLIVKLYDINSRLEL